MHRPTTSGLAAIAIALSLSFLSAGAARAQAPCDGMYDGITLEFYRAVVTNGNAFGAAQEPKVLLVTAYNPSGLPIVYNLEHQAQEFKEAGCGIETAGPIESCGGTIDEGRSEIWILTLGANGALTDTIDIRFHTENPGIPQPVPIVRGELLANYANPIDSHTEFPVNETRFYDHVAFQRDRCR